MKRYVLVDLNKVDLGKMEIDPYYSYDVLQEAMSNSEETEAIFKSVYDSGANSNIITQDQFSEPRYVGEPYTGTFTKKDNWEELKKSL